MVANGLVLGRDGFGVVSKSAKVVVDIESHHSNILPWKQRYKNVVMAKKLDAKELFAAEVICLTGVSNVTGQDFSKRIKIVRKTCPKAILGVDAAQMLGHTRIDIKRLGADFMAFSGHKFGAPMGIGGLIIKKKLAEKLIPLNFGGEMVDSVSVDGEPVFAEIPERLEAGTLSVGAIFGLFEAAKISKRNLYEFRCEDVIYGSVGDYVSELIRETADGLKKTKGVKVLAANGGIVTFQVKGVHPHDVAQILADEGIAVRAGWLCAEPFLRYKGWGPVVRASLSEFNTEVEVEKFLDIIEKIRVKMGVENV